MSQAQTPTNGSDGAAGKVAAPPNSNGATQAGATSSAQTGSNGPGGGSQQPHAQPKTQPGLFARRFPNAAAAAQRARQSAGGQVAVKVWNNRRYLGIGIAVTFLGTSYISGKIAQIKRDHVADDSWLVWKIYDGAIVEARGPTSLTALLGGASAGEDAPRVMELYEAVRALKWAKGDSRIRGLIADFSGLHIPGSSRGPGLGFAQIEELTQAIHDFKIAKNEELTERQKGSAGKILQVEITRPGHKPEMMNADSLDEEQLVAWLSEADPKLKPEQAEAKVQQLHKAVDRIKASAETKAATKVENGQGAAAGPVTRQLPATIAWTDTFSSQGAFLLASAFDEVYIQPSGSVPLRGIGGSITFFRRALEKLGIKPHAEARREYKSVVSQYTEDGTLTEPQLQNQASLLGDLNRGMCFAIGVNRWPDMDPDEAADKVAQLVKKGPFSANEAIKEGLITGTMYKRELFKQIGGQEAKVKSFPLYSDIIDRTLAKRLPDSYKNQVGVVYLLGGISSAPGDFTAAHAIKGLREACEDDEIKSIVLRLDTGGGSVVDSDSIYDAVRRCQEEYGKPVIASFGNVSASGGYYASASADAILACESTITGSIGVAGLRPTITRKIFDQLGISMQSFFTGSKNESLMHEMSEEYRKRNAEHIDETYDDFLSKVCEGRGISKEVIEELAGGRVYTGLTALLKSRPEEELMGDEAASETPNAAKKPVKLSFRYRPKDITRQGEFSTIAIESDASEEQAGTASTSATASATEQEKQDEDIVAQAARLVAEEEGSIALAAASETAIDGEAEDQLAEKAHQVAEAERKADEEEKAATEGAADVPKGPYGRGLIDTIGGLGEAAALAFATEVSIEIQKLITEHKMTKEQAMQAVRPGRPRVIDESGQISFEGDLELVRFPREKNFLQRARDIRMGKADRPSVLALFGFPGLTAIANEMVTTAARSAVRMLINLDSEAWARMVEEEVANASNEQNRMRAHMRTGAWARP
ncbi:hypothetical protein IE81DRAFT_323127 [Ceraceosorus guamensis]|uniref:Peptidase S49 domain-containing protein n=1 Tax=Ceraceosorus guamensis TaxID=1522189 RepID=A0A316W0Y4_9BASI|nr:hypothetical protein IE81DRAFT_323127 [Ceraceosorus guamensis]PWN42778.1 hypothetical protein IE81DRAFT_323127 [Ceraceosorus guamensis]